MKFFIIINIAIYGVNKDLDAFIIRNYNLITTFANKLNEFNPETKNYIGSICHNLISCDKEILEQELEELKVNDPRNLIKQL